MTNEQQPSKGRPALLSRRNRCCTFSALLAVAVIVPSGLSQSSTEPPMHGEQRRIPFFNVREYGATGEGKVLDTSAISIAIKAASSAGGGRVLFPPGTYLTGTISVAWADSVPAYFSHAIECNDFRHLDLDRFEGRQAVAASEVPVILLRRGQDVSVRNSKADAGTSTFLSAYDIQDAGMFVANDLRNAKRVFDPDQPGFFMSGNDLPEKAPPAAN